MGVQMERMVGVFKVEKMRIKKAGRGARSPDVVKPIKFFKLNFYKSYKMIAKVHEKFITCVLLPTANV